MAWDNVTQTPCVLVFRVKIRPFADTVTFIPDNTDDSRSEEVLLPKLVEVAIYHVKNLYIRDNNLVFQMFNVLVFGNGGKYNYMI